MQDEARNSKKKDKAIYSKTKQDEARNSKMRQYEARYSR